MIGYQYRISFFSKLEASVAQQKCTIGALHIDMLHSDMLHMTQVHATLHAGRKSYAVGQGSMPTCHMDIIQLYQLLCGNFSYLQCGFMRDCRRLML